MAITFEVRPHNVRLGVQTVAIQMDGEMVATIYPDSDKGIKLVSAHMDRVIESDGSEAFPPIPHIQITFDPQPYTIEDGRIVR